MAPGELADLCKIIALREQLRKKVNKPTAPDVKDAADHMFDMIAKRITGCKKADTWKRKYDELKATSLKDEETFRSQAEKIRSEAESVKQRLTKEIDFFRSKYYESEKRLKELLAQTEPGRPKQVCCISSSQTACAVWGCSRYASIDRVDPNDANLRYCKQCWDAW